MSLLYKVYKVAVNERIHYTFDVFTRWFIFFSPGDKVKQSMKWQAAPQLINQLFYPFYGYFNLSKSTF